MYRILKASSLHRDTCLAISTLPSEKRPKSSAHTDLWCRELVRTFVVTIARVLIRNGNGEVLDGLARQPRVLAARLGNRAGHAGLVRGQGSKKERVPYDGPSVYAGIRDRVGERIFKIRVF